MTSKNYSHRVFQLDSSSGAIAFIPTLRKAFLVPDKEKIPDHVLSEILTPESLVSSSSRLYPAHATLALTEDCNLRCWYCYVEGGKQKRELSLDAGKAVIDRVSDNAANQSRRTFTLSFFGGEPTMSWDLLTALDEYAKETATLKELHYYCGVTTNGIMSADKIAWLVRNITKVCLSIDGPKDIHDIHRPLPNGEGSWNWVMDSALQIYQAIPDKVALRVTVSDFSVGRIPEIVEFLSSQFPKAPQSYEPMSGQGRKNGIIKEPDSMVFVQNFFEGYQWALNHGTKIRTSILRLNLVGLSFCGACGQNLIISPNGNLSSCHRMTNGEFGPTSLVYGYWDPTEKKFIIDEDVLQSMRQIGLSSFEACTDCFARYSCRGDCLALKAARGIDYKSDPGFRCEAIRWLLTRVIHLHLTEGRGIRLNQ